MWRSGGAREGGREVRVVALAVVSAAEVGRNWKSERRRSAHLLPENEVEAPELVAAAVEMRWWWRTSFLAEKSGGGLGEQRLKPRKCETASIHLLSACVYVRQRGREEGGSRRDE